MLRRCISRQDGGSCLKTTFLCSTVFFFFFSSRRRHTRFDCDWSSDVCSSDLRDEPDQASDDERDRDGYETDRHRHAPSVDQPKQDVAPEVVRAQRMTPLARRSEEHTSELQSQSNLVCRLLLEKTQYSHSQLPQ